MRLDELINERRWEVLVAVHEANSMGELCSRLGASYYMTRRALTTLGIKNRWKRGWSPGQRRPGKAERDIAIIALREQDPPLSYTEIGAHYQISRERVRQILNARDRPDLCGLAAERLNRHRHAGRLVEWTCVNCGKSEKRLPSRAKVKTCSRKCFGENKQSPLEETQYVFGPRILELREAGKTWREIGNILAVRGATDLIRSGTASSIFDGWAKRVGADISHLRTGRARAKSAPPIDEIIRRYIKNKEPAERLAKEYGIAWRRLVKILKENNIPVRSRAEARRVRHAKAGKDR